MSDFILVDAIKDYVKREIQTALRESPTRVECGCCIPKSLGASPPVSEAVRAERAACVLIVMEYCKWITDAIEARNRL